MTYEELIIDSNIDDIYELNMKTKGLYADGVIGISKHIETTTEKACILAEEIGHYHTSHGDILDQKSITNRKQELRARAWAYEKMIPLSSIIKGYQAKCKNRDELAEYLDVTEEFLLETIEYYKRKLGLFYRIDEKYIITFEPLGVFEQF